MREGPALKIGREQLFWLTLAGATLLVLGKAIYLGSGLQENFATMGSDDIMRLVVVRDLIAGQSWFDMVQYRMLPPEGLSLHWSRYIDAGIAAVILPLSWVFEMELAEQIAAAVWPTVILLVALLIVALGTRRIFGAQAACFAILSMVFWPLTADVHAAPGNFDHHNVQFLLVGLVVFGVIWPGTERRSGIVAGLAAAFSLAVGLENLVFIVVAGLILVTQAAFGLHRARLFAFCTTLMGGSVVFWLGQAAPATRLVPVCDELGTPILSLIAVGALAAALPLIVLRPTPKPFVLLGATTALALVGLAVIWPLFGPCLDGPYANLSQELQDYISTSIVEALPAIAYAQYNALPAFIFLLPVIAALLLGGGYLWAQWQVLDVDQSRALTALLVFCAFGLALVFYQMRTVIMVASVVPMIGGAVMSFLVTRYLASRDAMRAVLMFAVIIVFVAPTLLAVGLQSVIPQKDRSGGRTPANCRTYAALQSLNEIPPAQILSHGNMGALLLWATRHDALSAPYHRSAAALSNGIIPFGMQEDEMANYLRASGASHLLLCRDQRYDGAFATGLAAGAEVDWLRPVLLDNDSLLLFEILPQ